MSEDVAYRPVVLNSQPVPSVRKPTLWDWVKYYVFNLYRKPIVWRRQKELIDIFKTVKSDLENSVLPILWQNRLDCTECRDAYMALKPQVFLSQIQAVLKNMGCSEHVGLLSGFLRAHQHNFERSEAIAAWINGFSR